jgi:ribosomal protein S27E
MKTVDERINEKKEALAQRHQSYLDYLAEIEAKNIPVYVPENPEVDRTSYEVIRLSAREGIRQKSTHFIEVACNDCRTALVDRHPGTKLASYPPKFRADCPGCGRSYVLGLELRGTWIP